MSGIIDKVKGLADEAIGKAKVTVGVNTDKPALIAEGVVQEIEGKVQKVVGAVKTEADKAK